MANSIADNTLIAYPSNSRPKRNKPGCDLGYTRRDKMAEALGCYAEYV
jgi:hypothetical protein